MSQSSIVLRLFQTPWFSWGQESGMLHTWQLLTLSKLWWALLNRKLRLPKLPAFPHFLLNLLLLFYFLFLSLLSSLIQDFGWGRGGWGRRFAILHYFLLHYSLNCPERKIEELIPEACKELMKGTAWTCRSSHQHIWLSVVTCVQYLYTRHCRTYLKAVFSGVNNASSGRGLASSNAGCTLCNLWQASVPPCFHWVVVRIKLVH